MSYSRIAGGMIICSLLLGSSIALATIGTKAGVTVDKNQNAVPANAVGVASDNSVGAVPAKDIKQLDKQLKTEQEQK